MCPSPLWPALVSSSEMRHRAYGPLRSLRPPASCQERRCARLARERCGYWAIRPERLFDQVRRETLAARKLAGSMLKAVLNSGRPDRSGANSDSACSTSRSVIDGSHSAKAFQPHHQRASVVTKARAANTVAVMAKSSGKRQIRMNKAMVSAPSVMPPR